MRKRERERENIGILHRGAIRVNMIILIILF
jgi:hypothetical protein